MWVSTKSDHPASITAAASGTLAQATAENVSQWLMAVRFSFTHTPNSGGEDFGFVPPELIDFLAQDPVYRSLMPTIGSCLPGGPQTGDGSKPFFCKNFKPHLAAAVPDLTSSTATTVTGVGCFHPGACPAPTRTPVTDGILSKNTESTKHMSPSPAAGPSPTLVPHSSRAVSLPQPQEPRSAQTATIPPANPSLAQISGIASLIFAPFPEIPTSGAHESHSGNFRSPASTSLHEVPNPPLARLPQSSSVSQKSQTIEAPSKTSPPRVAAANVAINPSATTSTAPKVLAADISRSRASAVDQHPTIVTPLAQGISPSSTIFSALSTPHVQADGSEAKQKSGENPLILSTASRPISRSDSPTSSRSGGVVISVHDVSGASVAQTDAKATRSSSSKLESMTLVSDRPSQHITHGRKNIQTPSPANFHGASLSQATSASAAVGHSTFPPFASFSTPEASHVGTGHPLV